MSMREVVTSAIERCRATPNRRELVFSPTHPRSHLLFQQAPGDVMTSEIRHTWQFANGSVIEFGHAGNHPVERYAGTEWNEIQFNPDPSAFDADVAEGIGLRRVLRNYLTLPYWG